MIVLVDVDCVTLDLMPEWVRRYNNDYSDHLSVEQITAWDMEKFVHPDCGKKIYSYLLMDDLYDNVELVSGAWDGIEYIKSLGHRVVFVSSGVYATSKFRCLERHNFDLGQWGSNYIVAHDKSLIRGDVLVDDGFHNIEAFKNLDSILFDQPWNRHFKWHRRAHNWDEVKSLINRWF